MERYIEITRVQKVRIPTFENLDKSDFEIMLEEGELFDDEILDFSNEEILDEDYSYSAQDCRLSNDNGEFGFITPYAIGTLYTKVKLTKI